VPIVRHEYQQVQRQVQGARFKDYRRWSVTAWLISINIAILFLDVICNYALTKWGEFSITKAVLGLQFWRWITVQFLHAGPMHLFFNMMYLYVFGWMIEEYLGRRKYLAFYLICGMAGPLGYMLIYFLHLLPNFFTADAPMVGASAGIMGLLIAAARLFPDREILFFFMPMRIIWLAWIYIGWAAYTIMAAGGNGGGQAAHLAGAAMGFWLIKHPNLLNFVEPTMPRASITHSATMPVGSTRAAPPSGRRIVFEDDVDHTAR